MSGSFESLDKEQSTIRVGGQELPYDYLVLATGAGMSPEEVPGLADHAETIWTPEEMSALGDRLDDLVEEEAGTGLVGSCCSSFPRTTSAPAPCTRSCSWWTPG